MTRAGRALAFWGAIATVAATGLWWHNRSLGAPAGDESRAVDDGATRSASPGRRRAPERQLPPGPGPRDPRRTIFVRGRGASTSERLRQDLLSMMVGGSGPLDNRLAGLIDELRAMLHRYPGESDDDYRTRVREMIGEDLAEPRRRMDRRRDEIERDIGVTTEQRAAIDRALDDAYAEFTANTAAALEAGDLDPYHPTWSSVAEYAGVWGSLLGSVDARVGKVLDDDQRAALADAGWDWGEYIATHAPWEQLPLPAPPDDSD